MQADEERRRALAYVPPRTLPLTFAQQRGSDRRRAAGPSTREGMVQRASAAAGPSMAEADQLGGTSPPDARGAVGRAVPTSRPREIDVELIADRVYDKMLETLRRERERSAWLG